MLQVVESAGIQRGFAGFLRILENLGLEVFGHGVLQEPVKAYVDGILASDKIMTGLVTRLKLRFPIRVPIKIVMLLFLYKAAADMTRSRMRSSIRSLVAPALLLLDRAVPLKLQKAISVRIW